MVQKLIFLFATCESFFSLLLPLLRVPFGALTVSAQMQRLTTLPFTYPKAKRLYTPVLFFPSFIAYILNILPYCSEKSVLTLGRMRPESSFVHKEKPELVWELD